MTLLTFIIPVRHPDNSKNWPALKSKLVQTMRSIANQRHGDWRCVIVANQGSDLPQMPEKFSVEWVQFPPNSRIERGNDPEEVFLDAFRWDKGRRVLAGMLSARDSQFFMIVDDDDFVSSRLVEFVAKHPTENGWIVNDGYIWDDGGRLLFATNSFNDVCGTSLIIRADLYNLPADIQSASPDWVKPMLGSHKRVVELLRRQNTPLSALPFSGAIYRVAQSGSHSGMGSFVRTHFLNRVVLLRPWLLLRNLSRLRFLSRTKKTEFSVH
ncbi:MAG: galactosyl transferase [Bdellovibrio sp.]